MGFLVSAVFLTLVYLTGLQFAHAQNNHSDVPDDVNLRPLLREDIEKLNPNWLPDIDVNDVRNIGPYSALSLLWGNQMPNSTDMQIANLTFYGNGTERLISLDDFSSLLKSVECGETLSLSFKNKTSFEFAIEAWGWVNENETHVFTLITADSDCAPPDERAPYQVTDIDYDEENYVARLKAVPMKWIDVARDVDIDIRVVSLWKAVAPRDLEQKSAALDFASDFSWFEVDAGLFSLKCTDCSTKGTLTFTLYYELRGWALEQAFFEVQPRGMRADLGLHFETVPRASLVWSPTFVTIGPILPFIRLNGILAFQPGISGGPIVSLKVVEEKLSFDFGMAVYIPDDAYYKVDLLDSSKSEKRGWTMEFESKPFHMGVGGVKASLSVGALTFAGLSLEFFGYEANAGLAIAFPDFTASLDNYGDDPQTICSKEGKADDGTSVGLTMGGSVSFVAGLDSKASLITSLSLLPEPLYSFNEPRSKRTVDHGALLKSDTAGVAPRQKDPNEQSKNPFVGIALSLPIWSYSKTLWEKCLGGGESPPPPPSPPSPPKPAFCDVGGGRTGICQDISLECPDGYYDEGQAPDWPCPNQPASVQCCIKGAPPPPPPKTCEWKGLHGTCLPKAADGSGCKLGYFEPGAPGAWTCPGTGANVECCIPGHGPPKPPGNGGPNQCKADAGNGICTKKDYCRGISYSEPLCPNDAADVLCCVEIPCEGADPLALPWIQPPPRWYGYCTNRECVNKNPPMPLDPNPEYAFVEPNGRDFVCPGGQDVKCCVHKTYK